MNTMSQGGAPAPNQPAPFAGLNGGDKVNIRIQSMQMATGVIGSGHAGTKDPIELAEKIAAFIVGDAETPDTPALAADDTKH